MPRGGARPGAGRPKGSINKISLAKAEAIAAQVHKAGRKLAKEVLAEAMYFFLDRAATNKGSADKARQDMLDAADIAKALAPFQTPRLASVTVRPSTLDLSLLSVEELHELERLHAKAATNAAGDTGGITATHH